MTLASILIKEGKTNEAMETLNNFLNKKPCVSLKNEANRLLIQCFIDIHDIESAKRISNSMLVSNPKNILILIDSAKILRICGKVDEAKNLLKDLIESVNESKDFRELVAFADELYWLDEYESAANVYERIASKCLDCSLTIRLIKSYYLSGQKDKVIEICKTIREKSGSITYISKVELDIYEQIGDLERAVLICRENLNKYPDDTVMKIRLGNIYLKQRKFEDVDKILQSNVYIDGLSLELRLLLALLYEKRGFYEKSIEIMYETRREYYSTQSIHEQYMLSLIEIQNKNNQPSNLDKVSTDCAVCVENKSHELKWFVIEKRQDIDIRLREINLENILAQELLGKSVGDKVLVNNNQFSDDCWKIIEIKSKYSYAFTESFKLLDDFFENQTAIFPMKISSPTKPGELPKEIQRFIDSQSKRYREILEIKQIYKEINITVGEFSKFIRKDILESLVILINNPDGMVKCCIGDSGERSTVMFLLDSKPKLVIDIISLITLQVLDAKDIISNSFGKIGIVQSTIDLLQEIIEKRKAFSGESLKFCEENGKISFFKISEKDSKRGIQYFEDLLKWINNNCEVIPCTLALKMNSRKKEELDKRFGVSFVDTIIVASQPGYLLYTDDLILRNFARNEFNVSGVWTQALLMYCLEANLLTKEYYNKLIIKLAGLNYCHTSVSANILIEAAKKSKWLPLYPYLGVIDTLKGSDELSNLTVATYYLNELWQYEIAAELRECLVFSLINAITYGRKVDEILCKLSNNIMQYLAHSPLKAIQIILLIHKWKLNMDKITVNCDKF